jgi:hypothetical protein
VAQPIPALQAFSIFLPPFFIVRAISPSTYGLENPRSAATVSVAITQQRFPD